MWITWPDMNNMNLPNQNPAIIEQKKGWNEEFQKALNWLKIELPKNIEEQETEVYNILMNKTLKIALEKGRFSDWITVKYVQENEFAVQSNETKNISFYSDKHGNILFNMSIWQDNLLDEKWKLYEGSMKSMEKSWYYCNFKEWKRDLYKIIWKDINWQFILDDKPLNIFSKEYYETWKKIAFYDDTISVLVNLKTWEKINKNMVFNYIFSWALNLKYLLLFEEKWLLESPDLLSYWLKLLKITEDDIKKDFESWEITKTQAIKAYTTLK